MDCEITFADSLDEPITIIMMGSYDSTLLLDKNRQPSLIETR